MKNKLDKLENETFSKDDYPMMPPSDIIAYNELRSCADLYRMHAQGILDIKPEFQREVVWKNPDKTRFIDSLVKGLPIPSMCFSLDYKTQRWQVIDGLQRMSTIINFLGETWSLSELKDIDSNLSGKSTEQLQDENSDLHYLYTRVENLTLPITVLRCDHSKKSHTDYLFTIFHRLNTGGMKLNNQEIRNCIFSGSLNNLLKKLDENTAWRKINRMKKNVSYRFTKQELILRFFAFHDRYKDYDGKLARFLNNYMGDKKDLDDQSLEKKKTLFKRTVKIVHNNIFDGKKAPKTSISLLEALLVGVSFNLKYIETKPSKE